MQKNYRDPSKKLVFLANTFLIVSIILISFLIIFASFRYYISENINKEFYLIYLLIFIIFLISLIYVVKRSDNNTKINFSLIIFVVGITLYSLEIYLQFFNQGEKEKVAKKIGIEFDKRSTKDVLIDLRKKGYDAHPNLKPTFFRETNGIYLLNKKEKVYPLGTISNSFTILGNESGYYPLIKTDEYGFNNPKGLYKNKNLDIVLIGDSFTEGKSVRDNENISANLRKKKYSVVNLGKSGNGPLIELATLNEFASVLKPKILLWFYFAENDLGDLEKEMKSSFLKKYITNQDFSQKLMNRQVEIDEILKNYSREKFRIEAENNLKNIKGTILNILKLYHLRLIFRVRPSNEPTPALSQILKISDKKVSSWGGKMYFVYLPARGYVHPTREFVLKTVKDLNIPVIDLKKEIFDVHPDPLSLFPLRIYAHYNAKGYAEVAKIVYQRLIEDGFKPSNE